MLQLDTCQSYREAGVPILHGGVQWSLQGVRRLGAVCAYGCDKRHINQNKPINHEIVEVAGQPADNLASDGKGAPSPGFKILLFIERTTGCKGLTIKLKRRVLQRNPQIIWEEYDSAWGSVMIPLTGAGEIYFGEMSQQPLYFECHSKNTFERLVPASRRDVVWCRVMSCDVVGMLSELRGNYTINSNFSVILCNSLQFSVILCWAWLNIKNETLGICHCKSHLIRERMPRAGICLFVVHTVPPPIIFWSRLCVGTHIFLHHMHKEFPVFLMLHHRGITQVLLVRVFARVNKRI